MDTSTFEVAGVLPVMKMRVLHDVKEHGGTTAKQIRVRLSGDGVKLRKTEINKVLYAAEHAGELRRVATDKAPMWHVVK